MLAKCEERQVKNNKVTRISVSTRQFGAVYGSRQKRCISSKQHLASFARVYTANIPEIQNIFTRFLYVLSFDCL